MAADRGYFKGEQILQCAAAGITPLVPKSMTSNGKAEGRFDKQDFIYSGWRPCPPGTATTSVRSSPLPPKVDA